MNGIDEPHLMGPRSHYHAMSSDSVAEEAHPFENVAVGDAGTGEADVLARGEIPREKDAVEVGNFDSTANNVCTGGGAVALWSNGQLHCAFP